MIPYTNRMVAVTGASGFIGSALCQALESRGIEYRRIVRDNASHFVGSVAIGDIGPSTDWSSVLEGVDCVVHCAARAHLLGRPDPKTLSGYCETNVAGTRRMAEQAAQHGVRRIVFISSIGVLGAHTDRKRAFRSTDQPAPSEPYAVSKLKAERELIDVSESRGIEVVVIRPPLVYGPGAKGNLARLLGLLERRIPLPLGSVDNLRSFVSIDNLVHLLVLCVHHPMAGGRVFLVSDGQDVSTPQFLVRLGREIGHPARLLPVPVSLLRLAAALAGRATEIEKLLCSLRVDISDTCRDLGWVPPITLDEGLRRMAGSTPE